MNASAELICIVDDDDMVRESICMLAAAHDYRARGYASCQHFLDSPERPDCACLILDVRLPGISGPELQERLTAKPLSPPIIFISGHGTVPLAVKAMQLGALDFLQKPFDETALLGRIRQAIDQFVQARNTHAEKSALAERLSQISQREREVMAAMARGIPTKLIADQLGISIRTVEQHRASLKRKLGARSLAAVLQASTALQENLGCSDSDQQPGH
jgi:FixJ family two-component response regulator